MSRLAKAFLILLLVAIPLRGMAGVMGDFCQPQHHGAGQMAPAEHDGLHHEEPGDDSDAQCSHCAACTVSAPLASESARDGIHVAVGALLVPFLDRSLPAPVAGRLDRPPLAL